MSERSHASRTTRPGAAPARAVVAPANHPLERAADRVAAGGAPARAPAAPASVSGLRAPRIVDQVLGRSGQPLDAASRAHFEPRFGRDLSNVRIHHDDLAARSAASIGAQAFNSGFHIVFGRGQWQPHTGAGRQLLAHELAHTGQARASGPPVVWRKALDTSDFDAGNFTDTVLLAYLKLLRDTDRIQDDNDSDDKARGVVRRWRQGGDAYALEPRLKVLLVKEMQSGFTGDDDERAILELLQYSARPDVESMFAPGQLDPDDLDSDFQGDEEDVLRAFYDKLFIGGRKAALKGKGAAGFTAEDDPSMKGPYAHAKLQAEIAERMARIDLVVRDRPFDDRPELATRLVRIEAAKVQAEIHALPPDQRDAATQDLTGDRAQRDSQSRAIDTAIEKAKTPVEGEILARKQLLLKTEVLLLDLAMQTGLRDLAMGAPSDKAAFQKLTTPLDAAKKKAAKEAITPMTAAEVQAEATGGVAPPPAVFNKGPLKGEKDTYEDKVKARIPDLINEHHAAVANRTKKEHDDPALTRSMDDMQVVANQSKDEVDLVFGAFYNAKSFSAFQGDKRNKSGTLTKKGNLRDVWQTEEDNRRASGGYKAQSAMFWLFYLIQNDDAVKAINFAHDASPSFDESTKPLNDEAKTIRKVGDPFLVSDRTRLYEIGRGWDAYKQGKDTFIQLFKDPDAEKDRVFMWDMYFTLMHEYLHKLAAKKYSDYADKLGGEHSTEGNTLIEGVDSLLTEVAWASAVGRASLPDVRKKVEPDAVAAGKPFDPDLLPSIPHRRYDTYEHAVRLVSVVGIRNLYAAYFQGRIDLIGA